LYSLFFVFTLIIKTNKTSNRYYDEKYKLKNPSDVELMFGDLDDVETDKEFEKRFDRFFKNTQAEFDSKTLLNIETMLFVLLMLIVLITVYTFKIIYNG
jgi:hypothetical protein